MASVVSSSEAIDAAFCSAERTTFVGSNLDDGQRPRHSYQHRAGR
jgi:hypothetical protein